MLTINTMKIERLQEDVFTYEISQCVKAIAIVLMVFHHVGFDAWISPEFQRMHWTLFGLDIEQHIAEAGSVCVGLFAFCSGYAFWNNNKYKNTKYRMKKLFSFLSAYWVAFAVVQILGCLLSKQDFLDPMSYIMNLFGITVGNGIKVGFAWYVSFYCQVLLLFPLIMKLCSGKRMLTNAMLIVILCRLMVFIITHSALKEIPTLESFFDNLPTLTIGILFAKFKSFNTVMMVLKKKMRLESRGLYIFSIVIIIIAYTTQIIIPYLKGFKLTAVTVPVMIFGIAILSHEFLRKGFVRQIIALLCRESTNLWYFHCIPFWGGVQHFFFWPKYSILIVIWIIIVLYPICLISSAIHKKLFGQLL